jgi:shikimate dehydrogenase
MAVQCGLALRANTLASPLEHLDEDVVESIGRVTICVDPLGRKQLAPGALVLPTCLEPGQEPPVDVVDAHQCPIGTWPRVCERDRPCKGYSVRVRQSRLPTADPGRRVIEIRGTTTLVGLLGWPTSHSLSPPMQNAGFAALGLDWAYVPLPTPPERLGEAVRGLVAAGFAGANVTIPHKQAVIAFCDEVDDVAERAGSVNTLVVEDGSVLGSSTDGLAVTSQIDPAGRRALVLGTGGASRAVATALADAGAEVVVRGRRDRDWPPVSDGFDVLVNATPLKAEVVVAPHPGMQVVDLAYNPDGSPTALIEAARELDCHPCVDGLDVLLAQGAASFERWTGDPAPLLAMRAALRGAK